ncbi:hypothetical protein B484DRAFT_455092 [Ochromonadaceae sp. CCMP2298]|nr:hypothetical protein B484DRAFT_455092 [Ochromonadaceae sp. CCMP2298]|eukprot:CAMPEP_0173177790 /NCGR_PEP_ID=MMETSP1141-20130122/5178_1 /TAXON_ID=483371 /ORGANISM="non described non described, Strain CCMP2298" /LENGTH=520 /DNA_ID=CAMNT_0014100213 /DNA_START=9 /DNA_END=1571 /DNA_ORIENTATION=-
MSESTVKERLVALRQLEAQRKAEKEAASSSPPGAAAEQAPARRSSVADRIAAMSAASTTLIAPGRPPPPGSSLSPAPLSQEAENEAVSSPTGTEALSRRSSVADRIAAMKERSAASTPIAPGRPPPPGGRSSLSPVPLPPAPPPVESEAEQGNTTPVRRMTPAEEIAAIRASTGEQTHIAPLTPVAPAAPAAPRSGWAQSPPPSRPPPPGVAAASLRARQAAQEQEQAEKKEPAPEAQEGKEELEVPQRMTIAERIAALKGGAPGASQPRGSVSILPMPMPDIVPRSVDAPPLPPAPTTPFDKPGPPSARGPSPPSASTPPPPSSGSQNSSPTTIASAPASVSPPSSTPSSTPATSASITPKRISRIAGLGSLINLASLSPMGMGMPGMRPPPGSGPSPMRPHSLPTPEKDAPAVRSNSVDSGELQHLNLSRPVASSRRRSRRVKPQEWDTDSAALSLLSCSSAGSLGVVNEDEEGNGGGEGAVAEEAVAEEAVVEEEVEEEVELGVLEEETPSIVYRQV